MLLFLYTPDNLKIQWVFSNYREYTKILVLLYHNSCFVESFFFCILPIIWTCTLCTNSGCGKREEHNSIWSAVMQRQHPSPELPWGLLALCQRTLGSAAIITMFWNPTYMMILYRVHWTFYTCRLQTKSGVGRNSSTKQYSTRLQQY